MIRPFVILAGWAFLWGYIPEETLRDYRTPVVMLAACAAATAITEAVIDLMKARWAARNKRSSSND